MRSTILVLCLLLPIMGFGQSLGELAKKEKERREKNKEEGKEALVITGVRSAPAIGTSSENETTPQTTTAQPSSGEPTRPEEDSSAIEDDLEEYERQIKEIEKSIAENDESIRQLDFRIRAASALGGGGLPVPLQTGTGAATAPMTGQDAAHLVGEQNRLKAINETLRKRKDELKTDLQAKGRAAGIPPGHLRF